MVAGDDDTPDAPPQWTVTVLLNSELTVASAKPSPLRSPTPSVGPT